MAKKKIMVTLCYTVGYTTTVEAEDEKEAIYLAKEEAECDIGGCSDNIDYVDGDDSCTQTEETDE